MAHIVPDLILRSWVIASFGTDPRDRIVREFSFGPLGFVPLGFGSLYHGIWPSIRVFGTQNLGVETLRVQT